MDNGLLLLLLGAGEFRPASEAGRQGPGAGFEASVLFPLATAVLEALEDIAVDGCVCHSL